MWESDTYLTIKSFSQGIYKEKGSRFIAFAYPVFSQEDVKPILEMIRKKHHNAKHHCFAYIIGQERQIFRVNDDGEPTGTAGKPILGQINSHRLTNILIIVVRYFGGKFLGVSGLINAYRSAAESAVRNGEICEYTVRDYYQFVFPYTAINDVMKIIKLEGISHIMYESDQNFSIEINFRASSSERILKLFSRIEGLESRFISRH